MSPVTVDLAAPPLSLGSVGDTARSQEEAGSGGFWTSESTRSMTALLAAASVATSRIAIGAGVYVAPFHHPLSLAQELLDLNELSNGRLIAGVGLRSPDLLRHQTGIDLRAPVAYMRDYLRALNAAMAGVPSGRCRYRGRYHTVRYPPVAPFAFAPRPPVLLAALGDQMLRVAAEEADGWILHPVHTTADTEHGWKVADLSSVKAQRTFTIVSYRLIWHEDWSRSLFEGLRTYLAFYGMARAYRKHRDRIGFGWREASMVRRHLARFEFGDAARMVDEGTAREIVLAGSTSDIADAMVAEARYVDRVCLTLPWIGYMPDEYQTAGKLMRDLLPDLVQALRYRLDARKGGEDAEQPGSSPGS